MASKRLDDLSPRFRPIAIELVARCIEAGVQIRIIDTLRTMFEQEENLANGVSWTLKSKHLPQPDGDNLAEAIDIAPISVLALKNWGPLHPDWKKIGAIGESLGLTWGGAWTKTPDPGHFEIKL